MTVMTSANNKRSAITFLAAMFTGQVDTTQDCEALCNMEFWTLIALVTVAVGAFAFIVHLP